MRPRIVDYLNHMAGTNLFNWLVPEPALIYALTMFLGLYIFVIRCRNEKLSRYHAVGAVIGALIGGLVGTRLFYLIIHFDRLLANPKILLDVNGGTASWGAYLGGATAFCLYLHRNRQPKLAYSDVFGSVLGIGPFIGRWACFLNGDDFGKLTTVPWGVVYPQGSFPFIAQVKAGLIDPLAQYSLPVHPVQLYLSLNGLVLFLIFTWIWKNHKLPGGVLFCLYWVFDSSTRFVLETFRDDQDIAQIGILSFPQFMCILIGTSATLALSFLLLNRKQRAEIRSAITKFGNAKKTIA